MDFVGIAFENIYRYTGSFTATALFTKIFRLPVMLM